MSGSAESPRYVLARQLPEIRSRVGYASAQDLADRVSQLGGRLDRAAISKIESRTRNVSLDEALLLAVALNVAPVHLFLPRGDDEEVEIARGLPSIPAVEARAWLRGQEATFPTLNEKTYRTEIPESEWEAARTPSAREVDAAQAVESARRRVKVSEKVISMLKRELEEFDDPMNRTGLTGFQVAGPFGPNYDDPDRRELRSDLRLARAELAEAEVDLEEAARKLRRLRDEREERE